MGSACGDNGRLGTRWQCGTSVKGVCGHVQKRRHDVGRTTTSRSTLVMSTVLEQMMEGLKKLARLPAMSGSSKAGSSNEVRRVCVIGASGKVGQRVVRLLEENKGLQVVAAARPGSLESKGVLASLPVESPLLTLADVDVTDKASVVALIKKHDPDCVVWVAGSRSPQDVDANGLKTLVDALIEHSGKFRASLTNSSRMLFDFNRAGDVSKFSPLDDVIMGGRSQSALRQISVGGRSSRVGVFSGVVTTENNGGFCQIRAANLGGINLTGYDGLELRVRGDGKRYKINLKNSMEPEFVFQVSFDTVKSTEWQTIRLPFETFLPSRRGNLAFSNDGSSKMYSDTLDVSKIMSCALVHSKFDEGGMTSASFEEGSFALEIESIRAFKKVTPRVVVLSSAAVTRPFWTEDEKRAYASAANIPIVALNPGNILGFKLQGEDFVRQSGLPYCIVRPTGLNDETQMARSRLIFSQGDRTVGRINRDDVARVLGTVVLSKEATYKTFEVETNATRAIQLAEELERDLQALSFDSHQKMYPEA